MAGTPTAAAATTLGGLWGGAGSLGGLGATILPVTLRVPSISGKRESCHRDLPSHTLLVATFRAVVVVRG